MWKMILTLTLHRTTPGRPRALASCKLYTTYSTDGYQFLRASFSMNLAVTDCKQTVEAVVQQVNNVSSLSFLFAIARAFSLASSNS